MQFDPGRILPTDPTLAPIPSAAHLVLRNLTLYVAHNDGFAPEPDELASMTGLPPIQSEAILQELGEFGLARFSGSSWFPVLRGMRLPPIAEVRKAA